MEMSNDRRLALGREAVWDALFDPDVLAACIPGCESVEKISDHEFHTAMTAKVGPVKARFKGKVTMDDVDRPNGYRVGFEGQGGSAGFAKGEAQVRLTDEADGGSRIAYTVKATVGGKLAQVGSRLIDGVANKMATEFFDNLTERLGGAKDETQAEAGADAGIGVRGAAGGKTGTRAGLWLVVLIVVVLVLYFLLRGG